MRRWMDARVKPAHDADCVCQRLTRFPDSNFKQPRLRLLAWPTRVELLVCLPKRGEAERRKAHCNKPRRISRIAGKQRHTATPPGAPPRRLKTLVRASGDVDPSGDFAPPTCPRPASFGGRPFRAGRIPRASRARACEARPQAPHPAGLGYPSPAKLSLCPTSGSPLEAPPHWCDAQLHVSPLRGLSGIDLNKVGSCWNCLDFRGSCDGSRTAGRATSNDTR